MNRKKIRVQVIGNYLEALERPLRSSGIQFENVLPGCSPLAMEGDIIEDNLKYCKDINHQPTLLNLRKNLSQMLSREPENFCQNYNIQPGGKEVRYNNTSDYLIFMNTSVGYTLFEKGGVVYSDTYPQNQFLTDIKNDKSYRSLHFPFHKSFNWKYYFDKFLDAVLHEYDSEHIILIRTNAAQWHMNGNEIKYFDRRSSHCRDMTKRMDEYFIERTGCLCIDEQYAHIPGQNIKSAFPFAMSTEFTYKQYERAIVDIIKNQNISSHKLSIVNGTSLERELFKKISSDIVKCNLDHFILIREKWLSLEDICHNFSESSNSFFDNIARLRKFLDPENGYTLSDYAIELLTDKNILNNKIDYELIKLYTKYMKLDINDIIAVYMLYSCCDKAGEFKEIISNIIENSDCLPIICANRFKQSNISFLTDYPYIQPELKQAVDNKKIFIRLENNSYIILDKSEKTMSKIDIEIKDSVDYKAVINNGYVCPLECADALCSNLAFYIERARIGNGNTPIRLEFDSAEGFCETLNYIDYTDILENERFMFCLKVSNWCAENYLARCNLEFLFEDNVKICHFGNGFNDQIKFYFFAKRLQEETGGKIYFDDIYTIYYQDTFNGSYELQQIVTENVADMFLSNIFSKKLLERFVEFFKKNQKGPMSVSILLTENGLSDNICVYNAREYDDRFLSIKLNSGEKRFDPRFFQMFNNFRVSYYHIYCQLYELTTDQILETKKYLSFPPFDDSLNKEIYAEMMSCDSVVMHIRRGDFITILCGNNSDSDHKYAESFGFYKEAIQKLLDIDDYPNKKYFIFSDDIPWCKKNMHKLGLDLVGGSEIFFVNHNKQDNSFRDMQLMMCGKIMIISQSGFSTNAAFFNERCEVLMPIGGKVMKKFLKAGKQYKYNVEPFTCRGMFQNWG